jgi:hypothetical protein
VTASSYITNPHSLFFFNITFSFSPFTLPLPSPLLSSPFHPSASTILSLGECNFEESGGDDDSHYVVVVEGGVVEMVGVRMVLSPAIEFSVGKSFCVVDAFGVSVVVSESEVGGMIFPGGSEIGEKMEGAGTKEQ